MALIREGSIADFGATLAPDGGTAGADVAFRRVSTLAEAHEVRRGLGGAALRFARSRERRGLALKHLTLTEGFEGFLGNVFDKTNEVYMAAWAWDLGGEPPFLYPSPEAGPETAIIPMRVGKVRTFLGDGALLFPPRIVSAGIALRIMLWESDKGAREAAATFRHLAEAVQSSKLASALKLIGATQAATSATVGLALDAAAELARVVSALLAGGSDDYVDFYEGYYSVGSPWHPGVEHYQGNASTLGLTKLAEPAEDYV